MKPMLWTSVAALTAVGLAAVLAAMGPAAAQEATRPVASHTDWGVYVVGDPKECYIVTPPTSSTARRDGQTVQVNRGDIRLFVTFRPADSVTNEVSFSAGYPIREGSSVQLAVGTDSFALSPGAGDAAEWAWPGSPAEDATLVAAMRRGAKATVTGVSSRGTTTIDEFSLLGFTAALEDAESRCN